MLMACVIVANKHPAVDCEPAFRSVTKIRFTALSVHYATLHNMKTTLRDTSKVVTGNIPKTRRELQNYQVLLL